MVKNDVLIVRCPSELKQMAQKILSNYGISLSQFVIDGLINRLRDIKEVINNEEYQQILKLHSLQKAKNNYTRNMSLRFIIRNFYKNLYYMVGSFKMNNNTINMSLVCDTIDDIMSIFEHYPDDLKEKLKSDIEEIQSLKNEKKLTEKFNNYMAFIINKTEFDKKLN